MQWSWNPARLGYSSLKYALGMWNHRRVAPLRTVGPEYALLNDTGHFYSCLHYYVSRQTVDSQLAAAGLRLVETFDGGGHSLSEAADDSDNPWLFYAAVKEATASPQPYRAAVSESKQLQ